ncbi:MAG: class I SAM-dependent methyltransferase [Actinomycetota bacterium]
MNDEANQDGYLAFVGFYDEWVKDVTGDVDFYVRRAKETGGPMVELGVGTGRIAIPTAQKGKRVIGVDVWTSMMAEGRKRAVDAGVGELIEWREADMRTHVADPPVTLVTIPYRAFLHLMTTEDQLACLDAVRRSLVPGGRLILNTFVPDPHIAAGQDGRRSLHSEYTDERGRRCELWVTPVHEVTTQRITINAVVEAYEGDRPVETTATALPIRMVYRYEMEHMLARAGFEVEALHGDFDERPLTDDSREMIWVARSPSR